MIEVRLVCNECDNATKIGHSICSVTEGNFSVWNGLRHICGECGADMKLQVVRIESETKETIVN